MTTTTLLMMAVVGVVSSVAEALRLLDGVEENAGPQVAAGHLYACVVGLVCGCVDVWVGMGGWWGKGQIVCRRGDMT